MGRRKIESPDGQAAGRDIHNNGDDAPAVSVQTIAGGTNIIGNQGPVHVTVGAVRKTVRHVIEPGPEHLSAEQRVTLKGLHAEWVALHAALKRKPLSHQVAWQRINKAGCSTTYSLILASRFDEVCAFVKEQMAILRGMKSAPKKDVDWRAKRIGAIKARCIKQLGNPDAYRPYIRKYFKAESLTELSTDQLQRTYAHIMGQQAAA